MVTYVPSHNGGRTQINPNMTSIDRSYPYLNHLKASVTFWVFNTNGNSIPVTPDYLDDNGYFKVFANGGVFTTFVVPTSAKRSGNYVCGWSGSGTISLNGTSSSLGRFTIAAPSDGSMVLSITAVNSSSNYPGVGGGPNGIYVCHEDDESALLASSTLYQASVFGTKFLQRLREANFGVLRAMNVLGSPYTGGNGTSITNWASRKPVNYAFYATWQLRADLYCATCTNSGNAYSATSPTGWVGTAGGKPADKQIVHVVFNASASAAPCTLKITGGSGGDTGDINILNASSGALGTNQYPIGGSANSLATLIYDSVLDAWIKKGGSNSGQEGIYNGMPPELFLQLCGEVGAHPHWTTSQYAASNQPTDYAVELASLCKTFRDTYASWMKPRVEGQNEQWNSGFAQFSYSSNVAAALWSGGTYHDWYGMHISLIGQMWAAVFSRANLGTQYEVLCGVQTIAGSTPSSITSNNNGERLSASKFVAQVPAAPSVTWSGGTLNLAKIAGAASPGTTNYVSQVVVANYFAPGLFGSPGESTLDTAYAGGAGDQTAPTTYADSLNVPYRASSSLFVNGTPGKVNWPSHGLSVDDRVFFVTEGTLATGVSSVGTGTVYFVKTVVDVDNFTISTSSGGTAVNFSGTPSGTSYCFATFSRFLPAAVAVYYKNWKAWALTFSVRKMCGYEGGYSSDYSSGGSSNLDKLKAASKLVTTMPSDPLGIVGARYKDYQTFVGLSDGSFTAEYPSDFLLSGPGPSQSVWAILEDIYVSPDPPQWDAIRLYNNHLRRKRLAVSN